MKPGPVIGQVCRVCQHPEIVQIEIELNMKPAAAVARQFGIGETSVTHHITKEHAALAGGLFRHAADRWKSIHEADCEVRRLHAELAVAKRARDVVREKGGRPYRHNPNARPACGFDEDEWQAILAGQDGRCLLCGRQISGMSAQVDHDHVLAEAEHGNPGRACPNCFRGILCATCNTGLGSFGDDPARLQAAAVYVEDFRARRGIGR